MNTASGLLLLGFLWLFNEVTNCFHYQQDMAHYGITFFRTAEDKSVSGLA
jgi:hypothetical protein